MQQQIVGYGKYETEKIKDNKKQSVVTCDRFLFWIPVKRLQPFFALYRRNLATNVVTGRLTFMFERMHKRYL